MTIEERHVGREKSRREIEGTALKYNKKKGGFVERRDNDRKLGSSDLRFGNRIHVDGWDNRSWIDFRVQACMRRSSSVEVHSCSPTSVPYSPPFSVHVKNTEIDKKDNELKGTARMRRRDGDCTHFR